MKPKDKNFAQALGEIVMTENVSNSYYNDENYVSCKSADLNKAYKLLTKYKTIGPEELESTTTQEDDYGRKTEFSGYEMLKIALAGDFGNQYKKTSSYELYYQAALSAWNAMVEKLGKANTIKIWSGKTKESDNSMGEYRNETPHEGQKRRLRSSSLADMVSGVVRWDEFDMSRTDGLKLARNLCQRLRDIKGFKEGLKSFGYGTIEKAYEAAETPEDKEKIKKATTETATMVLYQQHDKIQRISDYYMRKAAISASLTGDSGDKFFNKIMKSLPTPKEKILDNTQEASITL